MEQLLCDFTRRLITTLTRSNSWMYGQPNPTISDDKILRMTKRHTDTTQFEETWKPWELMERSSKLKKPGNSWILSFSHAILNFSPCVCVYLPFPKGILRPCISPMEGWNVNLVFSIPRKHASNLPHPLLRFWKSQIDIEIIESKFVWKCYPPIQIREPSKDMSKRLEMFFRIFRKSICFRSQLSSLPVSCQDFKKTRKFTCNSSNRKDSGNVTGQKFEHLVDSDTKEIWPMEKWGTDSLKKVKIVGINKNK